MTANIHSVLGMSGVPVPPPSNFGEYVLLFVISGGGVVAVQQLVAAYKTWAELRRTRTQQVVLDRDSAVERVVEMLQSQLDEQTEDYGSRLKEKDEYYEREFGRRAKITEDTLSRKDKTIHELQLENKRVRRLLTEYQSKYGYLRQDPDTGEYPALP